MLEAITLPQLSYSHSDARVEDKAKFIEGVMGRKATVKSLEFPDMTVQVVGNTAIVRHLRISQTEPLRQADSRSCTSPTVARSWPGGSGPRLATQERSLSVRILIV